VDGGGVGAFHRPWGFIAAFNADFALREVCDGERHVRGVGTKGARQGQEPHAHRLKLKKWALGFARNLEVSESTVFVAVCELSALSRWIGQGALSSIPSTFACS
jgi:hypothetical protein